MPIAHPETLAVMLIDGTNLGETAPETWSGGTKQALKVWYYRDGIETVVQRGRVTPKPVTMAFKLVGPDAMNNALYLDGLAKAKKGPVSIVWGPISFDALIEECDYQMQRTDVTVTLQFIPITDPNPGTAGFVAQVTINPVDLLAEIADAAAGILAQVDQAGKFFDNAFQGLRDGLDAVDTAVAQVTTAIATVKRIADMPTAAAAAIRGSLTDAATRLTEGTVTLIAAANAQSRLPGEIEATVTSVASACSINSERLNYIAQLVAPVTNPVVLLAGDTLTAIADYAGVTVEAIMQANPDLARTAFTPGTTIEVPNASA